MSIDISKHPLIKQAYEVCQAIEKCGASAELTGAVTKASALMQGIANAMALLDKWQQESSTWQSVAEKQLAITIEAEKRIADQQATLNAARSYVKAHAAGDGHAFGVLQAIDRAAGISVKGE